MIPSFSISEQILSVLEQFDAIIICLMIESSNTSSHFRGVKILNNRVGAWMND